MATFLAISGSLRAESFNTRLINALAPLAPPSARVVQFDISDVPLYNQDLDSDSPPPVIAALRTAVQEADGIVISTPEYNHTIPAVTKNFIDWLSRPYNQGHLRDKKIVFVVASPGPTSGTYCLSHGTELLELLGNTVVAGFTIGAVNEKIVSDDGADVIVDSATADQLRDALAALAQ
jgi:chromate reductase